MIYLNKEISELAIQLGMKVETYLDGGIKYISYYDLIYWIFSDKFLDTEITVFDYYEDNQIHWLKVWYSKIISEIEDDELLYEGFVGMILNWFETKHKMEIQPNSVRRYGKPLSYSYFIYSDINENDFVDSWMDFNQIFKTKQEARHSGILKGFEIIKNQENKLETE